MNRGLTPILLKSFPDTIAMQRPIVEISENINPNWLAGFVDGEGSFYVRISKSRNSIQTLLRFKITQHSRDTDLMHRLVKFMGCGRVEITENSLRSYAEFVVTTNKDINNIVIPFFTKYSLQSSKKLDFEDFKKVAELMRNSAHLTEKGLNAIKKIKMGMNAGRTY